MCKAEHYNHDPTKSVIKPENQWIYICMQRMHVEYS